MIIQRLILVVRTLIGALFIFSSLVVLLNLAPQPELTGAMKSFTEGMIATGYLLPLIKITELVCGVAFLIGRYVALAAIIISPVIVNIFLLHLFVDPGSLGIGIFLVVGNMLIGYSQWEKYQPLFQAR